MKTTVLIDNKTQNDLCCEWGLSFHIEYGDKNYLLDAGGSSSFLDNAKALGMDIADVDYAVLSHAHYDHSLGMESFFALNHQALCHISAHAEENCYSESSGSMKYIGLPQGILETYSDRLVLVDKQTCIAPGVWIIPHSTPGLTSAARKSKLYVKRNDRFCPDDFSHEQSLVFETDNGLVVYNSCSHSGPGVIVSEVCSAFPGETVYAYFGGLHLFCLDEKEVKAVALQLSQSPIRKIYTGHCTGDAAYSLLKDELGDRICEFYSGMQVIL